VRTPAATPSPLAVWMDQGGTFTDVLRVFADGRCELEKVPTARCDLERAAGGVGDARRGTTVATNALLERRGASVLLLTTEGLDELHALGDLTRPELFSLSSARLPSLATRAVGLRGRIAADGALLQPVDLDEARAAAEAAVAAGIRAAAVVLAHGPLRPDQERAVAEVCRAAGIAQVSVGHEVAPSRGLLDRLQTTLADAALSPLLPRAPGRYLRSDGGLAPHDAPAWRGCAAVLSGPAGGVVATRGMLLRAQLPAAFGLDMGGTSADVCRVDRGPLPRADRLEVGGIGLRVPTVRLHTVAAGGGSRLRCVGGLYAVGPDSAGSDPGPAAVGRGGPATLTDCEVVLGRLPDYPAVCGPSGDGDLDPAAARAAVAALDPDRPVEAVAAGFREVAHAEMAGAVGRVAAEAGVDPRGHALIAFGGAGPAHACGVARRLGITDVRVPLLAGAFSALGVGLAREREERVAPIAPGRGLRAAAVEVMRYHPDGLTPDLRIAARHVGTREALELPISPESVPALPEGDRVEGPLRAAFDAAHRAALGFSRPGSAVEVVEVRLAWERDPPPLPALRPEARPRPPGRRRAWFGGWQEVPVVGPADADGLRGPALVLGDGFTLVIEAGWSARREPDHIALTDHGAPPADPVGPAALGVLGARLMAIATHMGARLAALARSVSIRDRLDFSCAVFDPAGGLVCNAPHVPVHLGAMGDTVRDLLAARGPDLRPGQVWVSNDPYAGGSHLPDITAVCPVFLDDELVGFTGARGHHVDVGGARPGSMPPDATHIDEEGLILRRWPLVDGAGALRPPPLPGCRQPDEVQADLEAQAAAVLGGGDALRALRAELGGGRFRAGLGALQAASEAATRALLAPRAGVHEAEEGLDDGARLGVRLEISPAGDAILRLRGDPHPGNRNTPIGVARACMLYVLRCGVDGPVPLNEGALRPVRVEIDPGGLFDPRWPSAVGGGNVETSQRLVDALLRALGMLAGSQGTMNNVLMGFPGGAIYQTVGGGAGAGPGFAGRSAAQVHMTNTRATDVEALEHRAPIRLLRVGRRWGSGGAGRWPGGDGIVREWLFLAPMEVSLLVERRRGGAPGAQGGDPGAPGEDLWITADGARPAPPTFSASPGDRLRVSTPGGGGWGRSQGG